jgi:hypothetical protein
MGGAEGANFVDTLRQTDRNLTKLWRVCFRSEASPTGSRKAANLSGKKTGTKDYFLCLFYFCRNGNKLKHLFFSVMRHIGLIRTEGMDDNNG